MSFNPLLAVLVLLALGGLLVRRREEGLAWAAVGLAGVVLFWPALAIPDGVVSPSGILAAHAPWQAAEAGAGERGEPGEPGEPEGNPILRDVTWQVEPWLLHLRRELRAERWPFWNPHQSAGTPYWGNGSSAPLFPLHLLFVVLPVQAGLVLLPWLRLVVGGVGAWALARALGIGRPGALLAALAFPLAGMPVGYLLFPMGSALALLPWVLLAVERLASGRGGPAPLAVAAGLQLLAGHPETAVHTALVSAVYLLVRGDGSGRWWSAAGARRAGGGFVLGWGVGGAIAAVALLPLAATLFDSSRWQAWSGTGTEPPLGVLLAQPLRLVLPELYGDAAARTWWGPFNDLATSVYVGAATLVLAAAGLAAAAERARPGEGRPGDGRLAAVGAVGVFAFLAAYHLPGLYDLLLHLPIVGRAAHHRLLGVLDLALVLLAAAGLERWWRGRARRSTAAGAGAVGALLAAAWALHAGAWAERGLVGQQAVWTVWVAAAALATALAGAWRHRVAGPAVPAVVAADLLVAHVGINPGLSLARLYPETGAVRFLAGRPERLAATGTVLHPNAALVHGLYDVRGDDSVKLARYEDWFAGTFGAGHPTYFRPPARWPEEALDRLAVRWLVTPPAGSAAPTPAAAVGGAELVYDGPDARVWERPGARGYVGWREPGAGRTARAVGRAPGRWEVAWRTPEPATLVVAEAYQRGWRGEVSGRRLPVEPTPLAPSAPSGPSSDLPSAAGEPPAAFLGIRLPAGEGRLVVSYRPPWLAAGAGLSLAGLVALVVLALAGRRRSGRPASSGDTRVGSVAS